MLRIGPNGQKRAAEARQEIVNQPDPQPKTHHRSDEDLRQMIVNAVENHGKKEEVIARDLARKVLGKKATVALYSSDSKCRAPTKVYHAKIPHL